MQSIVLFTALSDMVTIKKAINLHVDKLFTKPLEDLENFLLNLEDIANHIQLEKDNAHENQLLKEKDAIMDKYILYSSSDLEGNVTDISEAFLKLSGYSKEEVMGKNYSIFRGEDYDEEAFKKMWEILSLDKQYKGIVRNITKDGVEYWVEATIEPLHDENSKKIGYKALKKDITATRKIKFLSEHDPLTSIYNRRKIDEELNICKKQVDRYGIKCSIMIADLDKFKEVNDKCGHLVGDKILQDFTKIIKQNIRATDMVARWGGEEFLIIAPNLDVDDAYNLAQKLRKKIKEHKFCKDIKITSSFGISALAKEKNVLKSISEADDALYISKNSGRDMVMVYDKA
jgi:diguanylate cyclase (GGDEF)-like protein/PAS domain S-box-containing protein